MSERRLVGIDLGVATAHSVAIVRGDGTKVARRRCVPTVESLSQLEAAALDGAPPGTRLEVILEPTGPAWLGVAVFFARRGHAIYRVPSAKAAALRKFLSRHAKSNSIDAETLARLPLVDGRGLYPVEFPTADRASLDRRVRACDRLTQQASRHKTRIKNLVRQLMPMSPLTGDLGAADLAVLERFADPNVLVKVTKGRLTALIVRTSRGQWGVERTEEWLAAARAAVELYSGDSAVAFADLAAEVQTEVRLLRATQTELSRHSQAREAAYVKVDPEGLARSLPGIGEVGAPVIQAFVQRAHRFGSGRRFKAFTGLVARVSQTGETERKGQRMSKAGPSLLRAKLLLSADVARTVDPQLARVYYVQMVERGATHLKALCVVASHLAERVWAVLARGTPYVLQDVDGRPVGKKEAMAIVAERYIVPEEVRQRRRGKRGKVPQQVLSGHDVLDPYRAATRRPSPSRILAQGDSSVKEVVAAT